MNEIKYFGITEEITGKQSEQLDLVDMDIDGVVAFMEKRYPKLNGTPFKVAVNEAIGDKNQRIGSEDVLAILPPFGGG